MIILNSGMSMMPRLMIILNSGMSVLPWLMIINWNNHLFVLLAKELGIPIGTVRDSQKKREFESKSSFL